MTTALPPSTLRPIINRYLALKQALGRNCAGEQWILQSLDRFLAETQAPDLTQETFDSWRRTQTHLAANVLRGRLQVVRSLCMYRRRVEPLCFVPDPVTFPLPHQSRKPYIFTEEEIARLIEATQAYQRCARYPLRAELYRLALVLLYCAGLRRGEVTCLSVGDYDRSNQTLLVRDSKFHKSRFVVLSPDAVRETEKYLRTRRRHGLSVSAQTPLLAKGDGERLTGSGLALGIRVLLIRLGIRTPEGRVPRTHDVRHTFAVHALLRWYREDADLQAKLPLLSTYMGHVTVSSTERYLQLVEDLAQAASARFARLCGDLVKPMAAPAGGAS